MRHNIPVSNFILVTTPPVRAKYTLKVHSHLVLLWLTASFLYEPSLFNPHPPLKVVLPRKFSVVSNQFEVRDTRMIDVIIGEIGDEND